MLTLIDLWILLQGLIGLFLGYIITVFVIAQLSAKYPTLEQIAVWGLKLLPKLSKIIGKVLLNNMKKKIRVSKPEASIHTDRAYPTLLFKFCIDSKAPIDFKPTELTAYVYMASAFMGKVHWSETEKIGVLREKVAVSLAGNYEFDEVQDLKAQGESWAYLFFTPTLDVFKSKFAWKWHLEVFLTFSSRIGDISKHFPIDFKIKSDQIESIKL